MSLRNRGWTIPNWKAKKTTLRELAVGAKSRAGPARDALRAWAAALRLFLARERTRRALKKGAAVALAGLLLAAFLFFTLRTPLLRFVLDSKLGAYVRRHPGAIVEVAAARFAGLSRVELEGVRLRTADGILALGLGRAQVTLSFARMLLGKAVARRLQLADLQVDLRPGAPLNGLPVAALPRPAGAAPGTAAAPGKDADYGKRVAGLLDLFFDRLPDSVAVDRVTLHTVIDGVRQGFYIPRLGFRGPSFDSPLEVFEGGTKWACRVSGTIERGRHRLALRLLPAAGSDAVLLPFVARQWGLRVGFASLAVGLQSRGRRGGALRLAGTLAVERLALNHPRIAAADVDIENAALSFSLRIGADTVELAEPTEVSFNRLRFQPYVRLRARPTRQLILRVPETRFPADDLFSSLPAGLFTRLAGMRTGGELAFHLLFVIDLARPEELELDVGLEKARFRIRRFGAVDFRAVSAPFLYTPWEKDRPAPSFMVGPENPDFRPLERIPSFLKSAVMISEDGAFFSHRGFLLEPFKNSIAANLKAGRFVRGASTISMQLIKNLYLRRHKTVARKLEEMLITWLVEENGLVSKERMLEIYLNIIEWGPGIYGAQPAARFYFAKDVEALTLAEAVFLAAIIPRPRRFMNYFDENQRLRSWLRSYYADVAGKMLARGWITQEDHDSLLPEVTLRGPALLLLPPGAAPGNEPLLEPPADEAPDRP